MRRVLSLAATAGCCVLSACAVLSNNRGAAMPSPTAVDTIAARLADLELQRIAIEAGNATDAVSTMSVDRQIGTLQEHVRELPNHGFVEHAVTERVLLALDAHESGVAARIRALRQVYTDDYPTVRQAVVEKKLLAQRRGELLTALNRGGMDSQ